jgi:hypothetical protein
MTFCIQFLDYEEGSAARWHEVIGTRHESRDNAREHLKRIRATDDEYLLYAYRITEVNSAAYFAQPTDASEY